MQSQAQHHIAAESSDWVSAMCVVALVIEQPDWAYTNGICRRFEAAYDHLLPMSPTRVKQLLARVLAEGLIDRRSRTTAGPTGRQFYFGTPTGARTYLAWLASASMLDPLGLEARLIAASGSVRALHLVIDGVYQSSMRAIADLAPPHHGSTLGARLSQDLVRRRHQAGVAWATKARTLLEETAR